MDVAILSDTHVPGQADAVPEQFRDRVAAADHVIHAGDFGSAEAYADVDALATELTAVYGNADPADVDLPPVASVTVGGVTFVVTHGIVNHVERAVCSSEGVVYGREDWLDAIAAVARARADVVTEPDAEGSLVGIGGHSHALEDEVHEGVRLLNPGSATGVGPADEATMLTVEAVDGEVSVTVHEA